MPKKISPKLKPHEFKPGHVGGKAHPAYKPSAHPKKKGK